MNEVTEAEVQ